MNILIADDSMFMRNMLKDIVQRLGFDVIEASTGEQACILYSIFRPKIVMLDIIMPDMDGIQCLKNIREFGDDVYIVMCSAMGQKYYVEDAYAAGANDFIVKPFQADRIKESIYKSPHVHNCP